jgi:hypothetical protein
MKKNIIGIILILLLAILTTPGFSQITKVGQTGLQFLKVDAGAREAAMGGAMTTITDGANSVFYNPAGLARQETLGDVAGNHTQWFADIAYSSFAASYTLEGIGTFGLHGIFTDYGDDIIGTRVADTELGYIETGAIDVGAYSFGLSYARNLSSKFAIGGTVKYVGQSLGSNLMPDGSTKNNEVSGVGFDFGTIFYPGWKSFRFGMSVKNFGTELEYEKESFEIPLTFSIGVGMNIMTLFGMDDQTLLLAVDAVHPRAYSERVNLGAEYLLINMIALRAGYKTNHDNEGFNAGVGLYLDVSGIKVKADYSYSDMQNFDGINRFSLGVGF